MMQINNSFQKNANISMVAQLLWKQPGISRVEIARQLDLYRSTVSNIINSLIEHGVVFEEKEGSATPLGGRKPISLILNDKFGCVIGLEIQPPGYHAVIINVFGTVLYSVSGSLPDAPFDRMAGLILDAVMPKVADIGIPLLGICAGMPGIIDSGQGVIVRSDPFQLAKHDFASAFSAKYGVPVMVENDANCLAWMELANHRGDNLKSFICLNAEYHHKESRFGERTGMGVGLGLAIGGSVYSGSRNAAGEFVSVSWRDGGTGQTGLPPEVMNSLESDSASFEQWVVDLFASFGSVVSVLDPAAVFFHGELARHSARVLEIVEKRVPQFNALLKRSSCGVFFGDGSEYSVAVGAALMFYQYLFSVPGSSTGEIGRSIDWDTVFKLTDFRN